MKRRLLRILSITSLVAMLLFTMAGIALAVDYYLYVKVSSEAGTSDYAPLALVADLNNQSLADLGYISDSGLDTRVTYAGSELKHMVAEDKLAFAAPEVKGGVDYSYNYTMGNDPLTEFYIIPGYDGYITVNDAAALEPGNNFEFEWDGYVDTASGSDKNLVYKQDAFRTYVSAEGDITAAISRFNILTVQPSAKDAEIREDTPTTNRGNLAIMMVYDRTGMTYRLLFEFDISGLPAGKTLDSANLQLYYGDFIDTDPVGKTIWAYKQTHTDWVEMEATWNIYKTGSNWTQAGGDYVTSDPSGGSTTFPASTYTWMSWGVLDIVQDAYDSANPAEFLVKYETEGLSSGWSRAEIRSKEYSGESYRPKLVINYSDELSVTATGISSGEHKVKVTADGTNLKIYIDDVEEDSVALGGASVLDNANNWTLIQNNVAPYLDFYKHTVSSTLIAWYQPNDMIPGTTLPDREGAAQNGTITWGSLPTGISTTIGSLKIVNLQKISKEKEEGAYLELFQEVPPEWEGMYSGEQYDVLPGSEVISELAAAGQIPIKLFWVPVIFGIAIFAGFALYSKTENIMAVAIAGGIVIGLFCAIGMLAWWVIIPYSIISVALCVSEKTYGF